MTVPVLATERLILRAPEPADFEGYAAFYASERSVWEDGPLSRGAAWAEFAAWAGGVAARRGYAVRYLPVGDDDPEVVPPTQLAVFTR